MVLPIVNNENTPPLNAPLIEIWDDGVAFLWNEEAIDNGAALPVVLPPAAAPGMWAVKLWVAS
jgi:hypothetical protein